MTHAVLVALALTLAGQGAAGNCAEPAPGYISEIKQYLYEAVKRNVSAMVDKMPEEHFAYKPVPEIRSSANRSHTSPMRKRATATSSPAPAGRRSTPTKKERRRSSWRP